MELPHTCPSCQTLQMVEYDYLALERINKTTGRIGYTCSTCLIFNALYVTTASLVEATLELRSMKRTHSKFYFRFQKTLHKAMQVQVKNG